MSTIDTTLEAVARAGLRRQVRGEGRRLRVDGTLHDHDHVVCRRCGASFDTAQASPARIPSVQSVRWPIDEERARTLTPTLKPLSPIPSALRL